MPIRKNLLSFEEGLAYLQKANDFITLREAINEMLAIVEPQKAHLAKDKIARVMRRKQALEIQQAQGYPDVLQAIDKKYKDLALVLRHAEGPRGLKVPHGQLNSENNNYTGSEPVSALKKTKSNGLAGLAGGNLGPMMLLNWIKAKKPLIVRGATFAGIGGVAYWAYQKYFGDKDSRKNPDKGTDFDRTIRSIQKYKAFSRMSKDPDWTGDYEDVLNGKSKKKKKERSNKRNPSKLEEWEKEEQSLFRAMDSAYRSINDKPKFKCEIPQLPEPKKIKSPVLVTSSEEYKEPPKKKPKKKKARKSNPPVKAIQEDPHQEEPEVSIKAKINKPRASRKAKTASSDGRLIPIVKRTKRVRKIS